VLGTGAGTYEWIFPFYKTQNLGGKIFDHAHNDYLEMLTDQGIVGFILLGSPLLLLFVSILKALKNRRDPLLCGVMFGVICGVSSMLIHAIVDFNFQIPANAAYFWCLLGVGVSCLLMKRKRKIGY
jgi:O-antigen ligase